MDLREYLRLARESVSDSPRQALMSSIGVFWGAATVVVLLSWASGIREGLHGELERYGRGHLIVEGARTSDGFPGYRAWRPVQFTRADAQVAEDANSELVEAILPEHESRGKLLVEGNARMRRLAVNGTDERYGRYRNFRIEHGRFFDRDDVRRARSVAVLGPEAAETLFGSREAALGQLLRIEGRRFTVVGVPASKGAQYFNIKRPDNSLVMVPVTAAEERLGFDERNVTHLLVYPRPGADSEAALAAVRETLGPRVGFHPEDPHAVRFEDSTALLGVLDLFHAGFVAFIGIMGVITLLIGGVGIANYQLALLAERTVEIAVSKAVGARNKIVVIQTVTDALLVAGGTALLGVALGVGTCLLLAGVLPAEIPGPVVSGPTVAVSGLAVLASAVTASVIPAMRVRRVEISEALRATL